MIRHTLPEFELAGYAPVEEYFLTEQDFHVRKFNTGSWLISVYDSTESDRQQLWLDRVADPDCTETLQRSLAEFRPVSIISWTGRNSQSNEVWLRLVRNRNAADQILVKDPIDSADLAYPARAGLGNSGIGLLYGLREDLPPSGGYLFDLMTPQYFEGSWLEKTIQNYAEWQGAINLFHARNGDVLLLRQDGTSGWWTCGTTFIATFCESMKELAHAVANHLHTRFRDGHLSPFDSHQGCRM